MPRIFLCLALSNFLLLGGTTLAGMLRVGGSVDRHILLAVLSLIATCFLQVLTFTYFTVTGKMIGQMVHIGSLSQEHLVEVRRHKRTVTRLLAVCIVAVVLSAATGGALWRANSGSLWHVLSGVGLLFAFILTAYHQFGAIVLNAQLFETVIEAYNARKSSRKYSNSLRNQEAAST